MKFNIAKSDWLVWACAAIALACGIAAAAMWWQMPSDTGQTLQLSESARQELDRHLAENQSIVASMPSHPLSENVFEKITSIYRYDLGVDEPAALQFIAEGFRDYNLGLYALQRYMDQETQNTDKIVYCETICQSYPDSKCASYALDQLLKHAGDKLAVCEQYIEEHPKSRLGVFALMRRGEVLEERGDDAGALQSYLRAWIHDPKRGPRLYNAAHTIWEDHGFWVYDTLLQGDFLDNPALNPLRERALREAEAVAADSAKASPGMKRLWDAKGDPATLRAITEDDSVNVLLRVTSGAALARVLLQDKEYEEGVSVLEQVLDLVQNNAKSSPEWVDLYCAICVSEVPSETPRDASEGRALLLAQNKFAQLQKASSATISDSLPALAQTEQAYLLHRLGTHYWNTLDVAAAADRFEQAFNLGNAHTSVRKRVAMDLADLYVEEWGNHTKAGDVYVDLIETLPPDTVDPNMRYRAGLFYYEGKAFPTARAQFDALADMYRDEPSVRDAAAFMTGLCYLKEDNTEAARETFLAVTESDQQTELAARAAYLLGTLHMGQAEYASARDWFAKVVQFAPSSDYASKAQEYVSKLEELETQG